MKYFSHVVIGVVCAAIVAGFFIVGSPQNSRTSRFDERRVSDLQNIQWQIVNYWQRKAALPPSLDALRDDISGYSVPIDPNTETPYAYEKTGTLSFKLCATFETQSAGDANETIAKPVPARGGFESETWQHGVGFTCFERTIDPELYKPIR